LCERPTDLGPSDAYVRRDLTRPHVLDADGTIAVPDGEGIGRRPDPDVVEAVTLEVEERRR
jgi:L-alanine-DL-glutamate epimerase-like enolase superfamily enzyme